MALIAPHPKISEAWNTRGWQKMACHALSWIFYFKPLKPMWIARDAESTKLLLPWGSVLFYFHSSCAAVLTRPSWKAGSASPPLGMSCPESSAPQLLPHPWQWPHRFRLHKRGKVQNPYRSFKWEVWPNGYFYTCQNTDWECLKTWQWLKTHKH